MRIAAILLGAVLNALALPPFDWSACGWFALVPLLLVVRGQPTASAFAYGVLGGYAYGWASTWPLVEVAAHYFDLSVPLAVGALALAYLVAVGLPWGVFAAGSATVLRSGGCRHGGVLIPALWVATELARGRVVGQPWALLGYTQHGHPALIQVAALTGVYGVSFLLALGATALAEAAWRVGVGRGLWQAARALAVPATLVAACWLGGALFVRADPSAGFGEREVAIVQTNVPPARHWTRSYTQAQLIAHLRATDALPATAHPALIVWPENAIPRYLEAEPMLAVQLARLATRHQADLLFGGPRYEAGRVYNSARLVTATGRDGGHYDKRRLVLFAEEKPRGSATSESPGASPEEFSSGVASGVLQSFVRLGVSICHEITHPDLITESVSDGAELLVNIANDGWLDAGSEFVGQQHLAMAIFRAVETRRYLVRAATTGTSAVIDPSGRVVASLAPGTSATLVAKVAGRRTLTPYARVGDLFAFGCACLAGGALLRRPGSVTFRRRSLAHAPLAP